MGLALDNAARVYVPENPRVREFGVVTATLVTPEVRAAADDARAGRLARARVAASRLGAAATSEVLAAEASAEGHLEALGELRSTGVGSARGAGKQRRRLLRALAGKRARLAAASELAAAGRATSRPAIPPAPVARVAWPTSSPFPFPGSCTSPRRAARTLEAHAAQALVHAWARNTGRISFVPRPAP